MLFTLRYLIYIIVITSFITSCNWSSTQTDENSLKNKPTEAVKMLYYDAAFSLDTISKLRLDGYYEIRQIFGCYTTNGKDYYPNEPTYGYLQFFSDGFCKVGWWNGFFQSPKEIKDQIAANKAFGFWGIYKLVKDTLFIEYLHNTASPGVQYSESRNTLTALLDADRVFVIIHDGIKYSFPKIERDSLSSSCIGKFVEMKTVYNESDNYLKKDIDKYQ